jgi:hypothetical protein
VAFLKSLLESEAIQYFFKGEHFMYMRPLADPVRLMVRQDQVGEAKELVKKCETFGFRYQPGQAHQKTRMTFDNTPAVSISLRPWPEPKSTISGWALTKLPGKRYKLELSGEPHFLLSDAWMRILRGKGKGPTI